jgi:hypothetical protein
LQLRNPQSLAEIGVDKNTTVVFRAPLMSTIEEIGSFLARENASAAVPLPSNGDKLAPVAAVNRASSWSAGPRPAGASGQAGALDEG